MQDLKLPFASQAVPAERADGGLLLSWHEHLLLSKAELLLFCQIKLRTCFPSLPPVQFACINEYGDPSLQVATKGRRPCAMSSTDLVKAHESTLHLCDGRTLGYTIYGKPTGKPLLYFGSSRLEAGILARSAELAGIRLIGIDRPGMGRSA